MRKWETVSLFDTELKELMKVVRKHKLEHFVIRQQYWQIAYHTEVREVVFGPNGWHETGPWYNVDDKSDRY